MRTDQEWVFFISFFGLKETINLIKSKLKMFDIFRPLIFKFNPETAHALAINFKIWICSSIKSKKIITY